MLDMMAGAIAAVTPAPKPADFDLFASLDTRREGAVLSPGVDMDYLLSAPSEGSLEHSWLETSETRHPQRDRATGTAYLQWGDRLRSSAAAASWAWLHDGTTSAKVVIGFRLDRLTGTADILSTFDTAGNGPGFVLRVLSDGRLQVIVGNGSTVYTAGSSAGSVTTNVDYRVLVVKSGDFVSTYLYGGFSTIAFGLSIVSPSSSAPQHPLSIGASTVIPGRPMFGWIAKALFFVGSNLPSNTLLEVFGRRSLSGVPRPLPVSVLVDFDDPDITFESGTEGDIKRIQGITNRGSMGGQFAQSASAGRPLAVLTASGRVGYFAESMAMASDFSTSALTGLHDGDGTYTIAFRFRMREMTGAQHLFGTRLPASFQTGFSLMVNADGALNMSCLNGGASALLLSTPNGTIVAGATYSGVVVKDGMNVALYLDDMVTPIVSGAMSNPSADPPSVPLGVGARSAQGTWHLRGWLSNLAIVNLVASQAQRETLAGWLDRRSLEDSVSDLIEAYAGDGLAHAYTPESLQVVSGDVTSWEDVVGSQPLAVTSGALVSLDGLDAVELGVTSGLSNDTGVATIASGTDKPFAVLDYGQWVAGAYSLWQFGGNGAHWWGIGGSNHRVGREDDGALNFDESNAIGATTAQRFFAHSFHSANGPNLFQVDGATSAAPLDVNPVTTTGFGTASAGPGATIRLAYRLLFDRALSVGEVTMFREALLREAT